MFIEQLIKKHDVGQGIKRSSVFFLSNCVIDQWIDRSPCSYHQNMLSISGLTDHRVLNLKLLLLLLLLFVLLMVKKTPDRHFDPPFLNRLELTETLIGDFAQI